MGMSLPKEDQSETVRAIQNGNVALLQTFSNATILTTMLRVGHMQTTTLHIAAAYGQPECIKYLLQIGASPHDLDASREIALHCAVVAKSSACIDCMSLLLKAKSDINAVNVWRRTPLMKSVVHFKFLAAKYLIKQCADVNIADENGTMPLHVSASYGNMKLTKLLLDNKANIDAQDQRGRTAMYFAILGGHEEVTEYLIYNGCNVNLFDQAWGSPVQLAVTKCNAHILSLLLNSGAQMNIMTKDNKNSSQAFIDIALKIAHKRVNMYRNEVNRQESDVSSPSHKRALDSLLCLQLLIVSCGQPVKSKPMGKIKQLLTTLYHKHLHQGMMQLYNCAVMAHDPEGNNPDSLQYMSRRKCRKLLMQSKRNVIWACDRLEVAKIVKDLCLLQV